MDTLYIMVGFLVTTSLHEISSWGDQLFNINQEIIVYVSP